jgi:hypothetical protein
MDPVVGDFDLEFLDAPPSDGLPLIAEHVKKGETQTRFPFF